MLSTMFTNEKFNSLRKNDPSSCSYGVQHQHFKDWCFLSFGIAWFYDCLKFKRAISSAVCILFYFSCVKALKRGKKHTLCVLSIWRNVSFSLHGRQRDRVGEHSTSLAQSSSWPAPHPCGMATTEVLYTPQTFMLHQLTLAPGCPMWRPCWSCVQRKSFRILTWPEMLSKASLSLCISHSWR